jgi:hypothetical protein
MLTRAPDDNADDVIGQSVRVEVAVVMCDGNYNDAVKINCFGFRSVAVEPER